MTEVTWEYVGGEELALFWINPWSGQKEKVATFWWPTHPIEATEEAEQLYEHIAQRASGMLRTHASKATDER